MMRAAGWREDLMYALREEGDYGDYGRRYRQK